MRQNRIIAINTLASYGQSLVALVVSLFSARWVLFSLGAVDFGLFGVVGSIILLITFLNTGLTVGVGRFYAFSIGKAAHLSPEESRIELQSWFNTAVSAHLTLALILALAGFPIGEYAIQHWMNIPIDRLEACLTVFRLSIIAALFSVISVPFNAMFSAHQEIVELALFTTCQSLAVLGFSWLLLSIPGDKLIAYALGMTIITVGIGVAKIIRAFYKFDSCRIQYQHLFSKNKLYRLFSFVGWKMFGISCLILRNQGAPILTNIFFGPATTAGYIIASRLSIQATSLSTALIEAFQPAIISAEGKGESKAVIEMCNRVCRFGSLAVLVFLIPLIVEIDAVLKIWLDKPPPFAADLSRWLLAMLILEKITAGHLVAVNARGKIAIHEIIQGFAFLVALPLIWCFHRIDLPSNSIGLAIFISGTIYCIGRIFFAKFLTGYPIGLWLKSVGLPTLIITLISLMVCLIVRANINMEIPRILTTITLCPAIILSIGFYLLLTKAERMTVFCIVTNYLFKKN